MDQEKLEKILGRKENTEFIETVSNTFPKIFKNQPILVTGGNGSLGNALADWFDAHGINTYYLLDINLEDATRRVHQCNILKFDEIRYWVQNTKAEFVFHFAAAKHAPAGEEDPWETQMVNIEGTQNVIRSIEGFAPETANLILSSTCKSCMPETCYGASKLIAERLVLNAGHTVARYYNVVQSSGNVFEIWDSTGAPYFVTDCRRYFISLDEAIALTLYAACNKGYRFALDPGNVRWMPDICADAYDNDYLVIPRRRGDRIEEPLVAPNEQVVHEYGPIYKVENYNDIAVQSAVPESK